MSLRTGIYLNDERELAYNEAGKPSMSDLVAVGLIAWKHAEWLTALEKAEESGATVVITVKRASRG